MSCSGYRFQSKSNPFAQYGIRSISVPMFYNKSNFADVSGPFTREIYKTLLEFKNRDVLQIFEVLTGRAADRFNSR